MAASAADRILDELPRITARSAPLLLVAPGEAERSATLREVAARTGAPLLNLSLTLSRLLLELPIRERSLRISPLLEELLRAAEGDLVLLDHLELLFEPSLAQDPLRLLQQLSRSRTLVAAWPGRIEEGELVYAEPGHPEHRRYPLADVHVLT